MPHPLSIRARLLIASDAVPLVSLAALLIIDIRDVTGHGVPAAMSVSVLNTLFEHAELAEARDPRSGAAAGQPGFHAVTLIGDVATRFMGVIDRRERRLVCARAGHTGLRGDGKDYVLPVEQAVRVSSGERGDVARPSSPSRLCLDSISHLAGFRGAKGPL